MNKSILIYLLLITCNLGAVKVFASDTLPEKGIFDLWSYEKVVNVRLTFDFDEVLNDRRSEKTYKGEFSFKDENGARLNWEIKLNTRGNFRRQICNEIPPIKINFKKGELAEAGLAEFDDFKLVTHCIDDYQVAKELLLKEYLVYRMFNELSEYSFRVQLVNITYVDTETGQRKKQMGFLIEDTAQLRARIGAKKVEEFRVVKKEQFHEGYRKMVGLFQYMIGNADWGITHSKNIKYVEMDGKVLAVPYDFDYSATVDAPYLAPSEHFGQTSRYDRVYLGFERSYDELEPMIRLFEHKREDLYNTIQGFNLMKRSSREEMIAFLDTFFANKEQIKFPELWD